MGKFRRACPAVSGFSPSWISYLPKEGNERTELTSNYKEQQVARYQTAKKEKEQRKPQIELICWMLMSSPSQKEVSQEARSKEGHLTKD